MEISFSLRSEPTTATRAFGRVEEEWQEQEGEMVHLGYGWGCLKVGAGVGNTHFVKREREVQTSAWVTSLHERAVLSA